MDDQIPGTHEMANRGLIGGVATDHQDRIINPNPIRNLLFKLAGMGFSPDTNRLAETLVHTAQQQQLPL